jgi:hypothetical protein
MRFAIAVLLAACGSRATSDPAPAPPVAVADAHAPIDAQPAVDHRRWFAGDVHMHCSPPDDPADVALGVDQIAARAREQKMDFVVLTPHLWPARRGHAFDVQWREMATRARKVASPTMIPGIEWTTPQGHFTVAGVDVPALGNDLLASAHALGAFVSVNHPFAVPTNLPIVPASHYDMSYRAWTAGGTPQPIDGVEVWNVPLSFANIVSRPGGATGEARAWLAADKLARGEHRRITAVGGTDNHKFAVLATTWVLALDASEAALLDALRAGATCIGAPDAGTFRARGDGDWVRIGGVIAAAHMVTLAWDGAARLFVDGLDVGEHTGGYTHDAAGRAHTYRIVAGMSRSGFIYANI